MGIDATFKEPKGTSACDGIFGCKLSVAISSRALEDAASFFEKSPLEIAEAFLIAKVRLLSARTVEINAYRFESSHFVSKPPLETSEITVHFFLQRGSNGSILSVDSFARRISQIWSDISHQTSAPFAFSNFLFLWASADFKATANTNLEISSLCISAITPNIFFSLQKIKSYPFDSDCFRHCLQTDSANTKFQHLRLLNSNGTQQNFRFGYFLLDPSGCLVPYLDGEEGIQTSLPAGVWCTEGIEDEQKSATSLANLPVWLSIFRYAFVPKGRRAFSISPVLAIHNALSNSVSFYSIRTEGGTTSKALQSLYLEFNNGNSSYPWYGYADRLYFHYFSGTEDLKSRPSRASSQHIVIHLSPLSPVRLPNQESLNDYSKMLEAVSRLASELGCRVSKGPTLAIADSTSSQNKGNIISALAKQNNKTSRRSVKFHLPLTKEGLPPLSTIPIGFEVPEASMLLEESMPQIPPAVYSPYRYFPSPPPPQSPCCRHLRSHHQHQAQHQRNQAINSNKEIALLDALVERLLSAQMHQQSPVKDEKGTKKEMATVGTSTPVGLDVCSVAVNTSAIWPETADMGLVSPSEASSSPKKLLKSVGIQCESVSLIPAASPVTRSFPLEFDRIGGFLSTPIPTAPQPLEFQQSSESVLSLETYFGNKSPPPTQPVKNDSNENPIGDAGYSRLLAGIQHVLQAAPHLRKTASVPGELSLLVQQPPRCTSAADNIRSWQNDMELPTEEMDGDVEADVMRQKCHCKKEVTERLDLTNSFLRPQLVKRGLPEKSTPRPGHSEVSFPATTEINSFTFATDLDLPSNRQSSRLNRDSKSTDESAVLMGLARKYLSPSIIAQLAPSNSVTQDVSDFSLSTRRYLKDHGLTSSHGDGSAFANAPLDADMWIGGKVSSSNETSTILRLTMMDEKGGDLANANIDRFLYASRDAVGKHVELNEAEKYGAPILNLEHLRRLPKLL